MAREINIVWRVILDFLCIIIVGLPILILHFVGKPYQRGFNCDDESIMYPFKDSTITNVTLYIVGIFAPVLTISPGTWLLQKNDETILVTEFIRYRTKVGKTPLERRIFLRWTVPPYIWEWYIKIGVFAFGACLSQMTTDIAKYSIGRLRPHFRAVCQPDVDCNQSQNAHKYIEDFQCTSTNDFLNRETRLSFLSGHSSFSAYTMLYIALYLQARMKFRQVTLLRPFIQALALYAAWYTALSRISDYKHHWSDVLAGSFQGTLVCLLVVFFISDLFPRNKSSTNTIIPNEEGTEYNTYRTSNTSKDGAMQYS